MIPVIPVIQVIPVIPVSQVIPVIPVSQVIPVIPVIPVITVIPVIPVIPVRPLSPVSPVSPVIPVSQVSPVGLAHLWVDFRVIFAKNGSFKENRVAMIKVNSMIRTKFQNTSRWSGQIAKQKLPSIVTFGNYVLLVTLIHTHLDVVLHGNTLPRKYCHFLFFFFTFFQFASSSCANNENIDKGTTDSFL